MWKKKKREAKIKGKKQSEKGGLFPAGATLVGVGRLKNFRKSWICKERCTTGMFLIIKTRWGKINKKKQGEENR